MLSIARWFSEHLNVVWKAFACSDQWAEDSLRITFSTVCKQLHQLEDWLRMWELFCILQTRGLGLQKFGIRSSWCTRFFCQSAAAKSASHPSSRDFWPGESVASCCFNNQLLISFCAINFWTKRKKVLCAKCKNFFEILRFWRQYLSKWKLVWFW